MTKVFALLSVAAVLAFASCADKKVEDAAVDTAAVVVPVSNDTATVVSGDTATVVSGDTATKAAH